MLAALADPILPIFAVLLAGFLMRRGDVFDAGHAAAINRFVFYLGAPALVFTVVASAPLGTLNWPAVAIYFVAEIATYAIVAALARFVFDRPAGEALLLGMAASFSNHVFFVRPIAILIYGEDTVFPIAGIVLFDAIIFSITVFLIDMVQSATPGPRAALHGLVRNPFVYAPLLGAAVWALGDLTPSGVMTFAGFAAAAAAPVSLFALGVVLAGLALRPLAGILWVVVAAKLALHPLLVWGGLPLAGATGYWEIMPLLVAAGPCGAMPFVIATQYGITTDTIAKAILISTALSVLTLSVLVT